MPHVLGEVLEADELALLLEQLVVLGHVLHEDVVGQVDGALRVAVVRAWHRAVHRLVGARNQGLVSLDVLRDVGLAMPQRLLIEDSEALVDRPALLLNLRVDRRELLVQLLPVGRVGGGGHRGGRAGLPAVDGAAELVVALQRGLGEAVAHVGADVEDQLVAVQEVVHLVDEHQDASAVRPHLLADLVVGECLLELLEGGDEDLLHLPPRGPSDGSPAG
mmetsp:Transcript_13317/g.41552  ORF Transcript_13317/g.41552 Transcript_13317/m.41552 type:complete len:219 (+) Transcript_13317:424-1080(+)